MNAPDTQQTPFSAEAASRFDLFLRAGCDTPPLVSDLLAAAPSLGAPTFEQAVMRPRPGFLGLDLAHAVAQQALARLEQVGAIGEVIDAAYRTPRISIEQAKPLAEQAIEQLRQRHFAAYAFEATRAWPTGERPRWWAFFAPSQQLQDEGHIPGAIFVSIDKLDGHVWTPEEQQQASVAGAR